MCIAHMYLVTHVYTHICMCIARMYLASIRRCCASLLHMWMYIYIYICASMRVCIYTSHSTYGWVLHNRIRIHVHINTHAYAPIHMWTTATTDGFPKQGHSKTQSCTSLPLLMYIYIYIYIYMYTYKCEPQQWQMGSFVIAPNAAVHRFGPNHKAVPLPAPPVCVHLHIHIPTYMCEPQQQPMDSASNSATKRKAASTPPHSCACTCTCTFTCAYTYTYTFAHVNISNDEWTPKAAVHQNAKLPPPHPTHVHVRTHIHIHIHIPVHTWTTATMNGLPKQRWTTTQSYPPTSTCIPTKCPSALSKRRYVCTRVCQRAREREGGTRVCKRAREREGVCARAREKADTILKDVHPDQPAVTTFTEKVCAWECMVWEREIEGVHAREATRARTRESPYSTICTPTKLSSVFWNRRCVCGSVNVSEREKEGACASEGTRACAREDLLTSTCIWTKLLTAFLTNRRKTECAREGTRERERERERDRAFSKNRRKRRCAREGTRER